MINFGVITHFPSIEAKQAKNEKFIYPKKCKNKILKKLEMEECTAMSTPMNQKEKLSKDDSIDKVTESYYRSLIRCLMHVIKKWLDILYAISMLSCFTHSISKMHLRAAKRAPSYMKCIIDYDVKFKKY